MTCMGMCGSGFRTGMVNTIIIARLGLTPGGLHLVPIASSGAAASAVVPRACGRRIAAPNRPTPATPTLVCAFSGFVNPLALLLFYRASSSFRSVRSRPCRNWPEKREVVNCPIHNLRCFPVLISLPTRFHPAGLGTPHVGLGSAACNQLDRRRQKPPVNADVRAGDKAAGRVRREEYGRAD